ncbi:hypothetical protein B0H11DRAFT_1957456 [Mycena galericulata]|nr:hypothetical protein B0H11DRAFT_1957456 [Mycena galericulata]
MGVSERYSQKYGIFNVSAAEDALSGISQPTQSAPSSSSASQAESQTPVSNPPVNASNSPSDHGKIIWGVVGAACAVSVSIGLAISYMIWRKLRNANRRHRYSSIPAQRSRSTPLRHNHAGDANNDDNNLPSIITRGPSSLVSLPSHLYEPPEPSAYSPAVESSDMFTSHGGHSPLTERTVSLSHFVRLVPLRRPGGRS